MMKTVKKKYMPRVIDSTVEKYLEVCPSVCIEGPKWCGKTWTSSFHAKSEFLVGDPSNGFSNRQLALLNPKMVLGGETPRMIDEWQEVPALWDAVRAEVDSAGQKGMFILTGSSTPQRKGIMHSGTGRIAKIRMSTMTLYESGDSSGTISLKELCCGNINEQLVETVELERLAYFICRGGWPTNIKCKESDVSIIPKAYMENVINEDIYRLGDGIEYDNLRMQLLLRSLARNESTTVSNSTLIKDIMNNEEKSVSRNTLPVYLDVLERMFILNNQKPFSCNVRSSLRVKQAEKRHFSDSSMACALLNITPNKLMNDLNTFGFLFESLVEHDLSVYTQVFNGKLFHYQDYKNNEIDAVIELEDGSWCAFEIKLGASKIAEGAENLNKVCDNIVKNGGKAPKIKCVICGLSNAVYKRKDGVFVVPFTCLCP